jgi:mRNA interferase RelE/StbE
MAPFALDIPPHVAAVLRHLPPDVKRPVTAALRAIGANPSIGARLQRDLNGLWRFRVRRFRIVYAVDRPRRVVRVMAVAHRRHVYDDLTQAMADLSGRKTERRKKTEERKRS